MTLRPFVFALAVSLPLTGLFAQTPERLQSEKVAYSTHGAMKLLRQNSDGSPSVMIGVNDENAELVAPGSRNSEPDVSLASRVWMAKISESVLGLTEDAELRETSIGRTNDLWLSSYELSYNGIPVRERIAHLNIGALNGKVIMLRNNLPSVKPITSVAEIGKDVIMSLADAIVGSNATIIEDAHLVYLHNRYPERLDLAYETTIRNAKGDELLRLTFDAGTGKLLERKDLIHKDCFRFNPLTASDVGSLPKQNTRVFPQEAQIIATGKVTALVHPKTPSDVPVSVNLSNLEISINGTTVYSDSNGTFTAINVNNPLVVSSLSMKGKYLTVSRVDGNPPASVVDTFAISPAHISLNDMNSDIAERDVYYSIEEIRRHIRALDPALTSLDKPMITSVNYPSECNAFYDQSQLGFTFFGASTTCNNIASVADVVYHEFGHRVNHARYSQVGNNNRSMTDGSLNEGFADIISAFKGDDPRIGLGFYKSSPTKVLRNVDNTNKWPKNISSDGHYNGLIVAGAFWDLRKTMGLAETERLFHMMCYQRPDGTGGTSAATLEEAFTNTLLATILTDDVDNDLANGTPNLNKILEAFEKHGITLTGSIELTPMQLPDQDAHLQEYPVSVRSSYASVIGALDSSSVRLYYRHSDSTNYAYVTLSHVQDDLYSGVIPKLPAGSIVEYYASASTTLSSTSLKQAPLPTSPMVFLVGYKQKVLDDCESGEGWSTDKFVDNASKGVWVHGEPFGTFYQSAVDVFIQQDTDHSQSGIHCFVTGNQETTSTSLDDVDNGTTSLISPAYDFSTMTDPVLRWWYCYSNETGQNPGLPKWVVRISNDDGATYRIAQTTSLATKGWTSFTIRVKDLVPLSSAVRLKFIASDNIGALVEASVDDIEILDVPTPESVYEGVENDLLLTLYPNPVTGSKVTLKTNGLPANSSLVLRDVVGKVVHTYMISSGGNETELAIPGSLVNGAYILEYTSDGLIRREKLILAR